MRGVDCAGFKIVRTVYEALNPGMKNRPRAHRARLNCNKELAVGQTMVTDSDTGFAQRDDLGMRGRIGIDDVAIPSSAYDLLVTNDHRAHRNFPDLQSTLGTAEGFFHPEFIGQSIRLGRVPWVRDAL